MSKKIDLGQIECRKKSISVKVKKEKILQGKNPERKKCRKEKFQEKPKRKKEKYLQIAYKNDILYLYRIRGETKMQRKIVKIVTTLGYFQVGRDCVTKIIEDGEGYIVFKDKDPYNVGREIEIKCKDILVYWE